MKGSWISFQKQKRRKNKVIVEKVCSPFIYRWGLLTRVVFVWEFDFEFNLYGSFVIIQSLCDSDAQLVLTVYITLEQGIIPYYQQIDMWKLGQVRLVEWWVYLKECKGTSIFPPYHCFSAYRPQLLGPKCLSRLTPPVQKIKNCINWGNNHKNI